MCITRPLWILTRREKYGLRYYVLGGQSNPVPNNFAAVGREKHQQSASIELRPEDLLLWDEPVTIYHIYELRRQQQLPLPDSEPDRDRTPSRRLLLDCAT